MVLTLLLKYEYNIGCDTSRRRISGNNDQITMQRMNEENKRRSCVLIVDVFISKILRYPSESLFPKNRSKDKIEIFEI